jgi:hypothetical protein
MRLCEYPPSQKTTGLPVGLHYVNDNREREINQDIKPKRSPYVGVFYSREDFAETQIHRQKNE